MFFPFFAQAPAAFGLVSFLLHEGLDRTRIRKHLGIFAAAAPIMAIFTYFCLSQVSLSYIVDRIEKKKASRYDISYHFVS